MKKQPTANQSVKKTPYILTKKVNSPLYEDIYSQTEECLITLDIKNNVISELQDKIITTEKLPENVIKSIDSVSAQVFYAKDSFDFNEVHSSTKLIELNPSPSLTSFSIAPTPETPSFNLFRFDLGNQPGLINIHSIEIKNNNGDLLWVWDKNIVDFKRNIFLFQNKSLWPDKIVQLSTWIDPLFYISTNNIILEASIGGLVIDSLLSAVDNEQIESIHNIKKPYSSISENQFEELQQKTNLLYNEISSAQHTVTNLTDKNNLIHQTLKTNELLIEQTINEKKTLLSEITEKNNIISNLLISQEKKEESLLLNSNIIDDLKKEIGRREVLIAETVTTNKILETSLHTANLSLEKLQEENIKKENIISSTNADKSNLESIIAEKLSIIKDFENKNANFEKRLIDALLQKKELETTAHYKTEAIEEFKKNISLKEIQILELTKANNTLESELLTSQKRTAKYQNFINAKEEALEQLTVQNKKLQTTFEDEKKINSHLLQEINISNKKINDAYIIINQLNETIHALENDIHLLKKDNNGLFHTNKKISIESQHTQNINNTLKKEIELLNTLLDGVAAKNKTKRYFKAQEKKNSQSQ
ncbi:MAG TPA: hypothetical protein VIY08_00750 [Candidatus Nitrosocosmicus sp.]